MKRFAIIFMMMTLLSTTAWAQEGRSPGAHLSPFDGAEWSSMKIDSKRLIPLLASGQAVLVDIHLAEEKAPSSLAFALLIPLEELPERAEELPRDKVIVLACSNTDRALIAVTYLKAEGFNALYLSDGLGSLGVNLRKVITPDGAGHLSGKSRQTPKQ